MGAPLESARSSGVRSLLTWECGRSSWVLPLASPGVWPSLLAAVPLGCGRWLRGGSGLVSLRPFLRSAVSPNLHTLVRYLMRGTLIGSCWGQDFYSYNPFHEA